VICIHDALASSELILGVRKKEALLITFEAASPLLPKWSSGSARKPGGRVEWRRARVRSATSIVSALSSGVANGCQIIPTFPPPPLIMPYGGFSPVRLEAQPRPQRPSVTPFRITFDGGAAVHSPGAARCPHPYSEPRLYPQALDSARFIMPAPAIATTA